MADNIIVTFERKYDLDKDWTDENTSPYIHIADCSDDIENQRCPHEIVIPMTVIQVRFSYPLTNHVIVEFETDNPLGFTRSELAQVICDEYNFIYEEEDAAVGDPGCIPETYNREQPFGEYGIWGHCIGDLMLCEVIQVEGSLFHLGVDS